MATPAPKNQTDAEASSPHESIEMGTIPGIAYMDEWESKISLRTKNTRDISLKPTKEIRKKLADNIGANLAWSGLLKTHMAAEFVELFLAEEVCEITIAGFLTVEYKLEEAKAKKVAAAVVDSLPEWKPELEMLRRIMNIE